MPRSRIVMMAVLVTMVGGMIGCNVVPQTDYDALQNRFNELSHQHEVMQQELQTSEARRNQLSREAAESKSRANRAEMTATRLQSQLAQRQTAPVRRPVAAPVRRAASAREGSQIILGEGLFAAGRATLEAKGKQRIARVAATLKRQHPGAKILVIGHTDTTPIRSSKWADNLELSGQRASAVTRELIKAGIPAATIETVAMGGTQPVASNRTDAGRAKNRRVVIKVVK